MSEAKSGVGIALQDRPACRFAHAGYRYKCNRPFCVAHHVTGGGDVPSCEAEKLRQEDKTMWQARSVFPRGVALRAACALTLLSGSSALAQTGAPQANAAAPAQVKQAIAPKQ